MIDDLIKGLVFALLISTFLGVVKLNKEIARVVNEIKTDQCLGH